MLFSGNIGIKGKKAMPRNRYIIVIIQSVNRKNGSRKMTPAPDNA
jgi:hypothetical protein